MLVRRRNQASQLNPFLDFARGIAAILVMAGHLRNFVFVDFGSLDHHSPALLVFYFLTGLGHQAVLVFFVMSGFLVGGNALKALDAEQWSWTCYLTMRMTRLWIVLMPALVLTYFWDTLGITTTGSLLYSGVLATTFNSIPLTGVDLALNTFIGNAAFLQTVAVPVFGTNGPLWSLANEFWYYLIFPLAAIAVWSARSSMERWLSGLLAVAICWWLPQGLIAYGLTWLFGVIAFAIAQRVSLGGLTKIAMTIATLVCLVTVLVMSRLGILSSFTGDVVISATFAAALVPLVQMETKVRIFAKLARVIAEFSYSLYLTHFPLLAFLSCCFLANRRMLPDLTSFTIYAALFLVVMIYAYGVYFAFERNTAAVQRYFLSMRDRLGLRPLY